MLEIIAEGVKMALSNLPIVTANHSNTKPAGTRKEVAEYLKISLSKLDMLTKTGELKSFKMGGRQVRYKWSDIEQYLNNK